MPLFQICAHVYRLNGTVMVAVAAPKARTTYVIITRHAKGPKTGP